MVDPNTADRFDYVMTTMRNEMKADSGIGEFDWFGSVSFQEWTYAGVRKQLELVHGALFAVKNITDLPDHRVDPVTYDKEMLVNTVMLAAVLSCIQDNLIIVLNSEVEDG